MKEHQKVNEHIQRAKEMGILDPKDVSDGYHTFQELYDHRIALFLALCRTINYEADVWRSKLHSDGSMFDGCFVVGIETKPGRQITYHLPIKRWGDTEFIREYEKAPCVYDGHTPQDVLERLKNL